MKVLVIVSGIYWCTNCKELKNAGYSPIVLDNLSMEIDIVEEILMVPLIIGNLGDKELFKSVLLGNHLKTNNEK